jgi:hypothetical protein
MAGGFRKDELDKELSWEEFRDKYLNDDLRGWISKRQRSLRSWLYSLEQYAKGDH